MNEVLVVLAVLGASGAWAQATAQVKGELLLDGEAPQVAKGACAKADAVLASVVFVDAESGAAVKRVDLTCARGLRFDAALPPGSYQAAIWPAPSATNLVDRPYEVEGTFALSRGENRVQLEERTVSVAGVVQGERCRAAGTLVFSDVRRAYAHEVRVPCVNGRLEVATRLPRGVYRISLELGGQTHQLSSGVPLVSLAGVMRGDERVAAR